MTKLAPRFFPVARSSGVTRTGQRRPEIWKMAVTLRFPPLSRSEAGPKALNSNVAAVLRGGAGSRYHAASRATACRLKGTYPVLETRDTIRQIDDRMSVETHMSRMLGTQIEAVQIIASHIGTGIHGWSNDIS